ncbi:hypothetical protein N7G274_008275 [Stereocaulon virgatum]|uniref:Zn(2)-C6 fungal-type domain-containing protein n=1 Tax=Stereocaulon virgatum TaxID=373712 RepID=A0ABR4A0E6_9LECA
MDTVDELFSADALRLLEDYAQVLSPPGQPQGFIVGHVASSHAESNHHQTRKRTGIPGCSTLSLSSTATSKSKRAKFEPKRKREVANVRKIGACFRCRLLKISCSGTWPCEPCHRSGNSCYGRAPKFRWMDSVSCSLKEVDIYAIDRSCTLASFNDFDSIELGDVNLAFDSEVWWDLDGLAFEFAHWMSCQGTTPASTSRVGILSSAKLEHLLHNLVDRGLTRAFKLLSESSSVLYNHEGDTDMHWKSYTTSELLGFRSYAGTLVLQHLERLLSRSNLDMASLRELKALFLIIFGTIIAVGYSKPIVQTDNSSWSTKSYGEAQQQLLRILAHHMVQIAERASILDEKADKMHLIESANRQWDRQAIFEWSITDDSASESTEDPEDVESQRSCFSCGAFLCPDGSCPFCLSQSSDGSIWEEINLAGNSSKKTFPQERLTPEAPRSAPGIWDPGCYQALGTSVPGSERSTCHSCGMIVMFPGDNLCFSCFCYSSDVQGDTSLMSSYEVPFFITDPPLSASPSTGALFADNGMRDLPETPSKGPGVQRIITGCDDNAGKLAQAETTEGSHWQCDNHDWYNWEKYPETITVSDEWKRCEGNVTGYLTLRQMDSRTPPKTCQPIGSQVSNCHQPISASLSDFGSKRRRRSYGRISDSSQSWARHTRAMGACYGCKTWCGLASICVACTRHNDSLPPELWRQPSNTPSFPIYIPEETDTIEDEKIAGTYVRKRRNLLV